MTTPQEAKPISFLVAAKKFFGLKPGQGLGDFRDEVNCLTDADKDELRPLLSAEFGAPIIG